MCLLTLEIGNSTSQVLGLDAKQLSELKKILCYTVDPKAAYYSGSPRSNKRYLIDKRGNFPTGLLYLVQPWVESKFVKKIVNEIRVLDRRILPSRPTERRLATTLQGTPYKEQIEAANACIANKRGIVVAPTGFGKSLIIALIIDKLQLNTLVVVPTLELKRQLIESLEKTFGFKNVGDLQRDDYKFPIAVENVDALDPNKKLEGYDCVIIDEFHHSGAKTYRQLNRKAWNDVYYKFGMTATPFRSQDHERLLLESVLSKVIYKVEYKTAVDKGYIVPMEAYYIDLPKMNTDAYTWQEVYAELVVNREDRNKYIQQLLISLAGSSALCLVKEISHGKKLSEACWVPFANGADAMAKVHISTFNSTSVGRLIGTTGILGEGIDTRPAEYIVIAGLGKSKNAFMQQCGRGFRRYPGKESCKIIIFRDRSHKWTLAHFKAQCKILKEEYGVIPVKLEGLT